MKKILLSSLLGLTFATNAIAAKPAPTAAKSTAPATEAAPVVTINRPLSSAPATSIPPKPEATAAISAPERSATHITHSNLYVGAQLGDSTIGAYLGYQLNKMYTMEAAFNYVDPVYGLNTELKRYRAGISGLAMFPIKFSEMGPMAIYVKAGYGFDLEKYTVNNPGVPVPPASSTTTTTRKTGVTGGAGIHVDLSERSSARLGVNLIGSDRSIYLNALRWF
jgi:opacity protein-like surface antigen